MKRVNKKRVFLFPAFHMIICAFSNDLPENISRYIKTIKLQAWNRIS